MQTEVQRTKTFVRADVEHPTRLARRLLRTAVEAIVANLPDRAGITDVHLTEDQPLQVERGGKILQDDVGRVCRRGELLLIAQHLAVANNHEFGEDVPTISDVVRTEAGAVVRITCTSASISPGGHLVSLRFLAAEAIPLQTYVDTGVMSEDHMHGLRAAFHNRGNVLVVGETGSGKTTLLRALLEECVPATQRTIIIEDAPELAVDGPQFVPLRTAPVIGVGMAELLIHTLRLNPARIVLGEVRTPAAAYQTVMAAATGHGGIVTTIHAANLHEAHERLIWLCQEVQPGFNREWVKGRWHAFVICGFDDVGVRRFRLERAPPTDRG